MNEQFQLGRAKNILLTYFEATLSIPKVYFDADWGGVRVDLLAINRDGAGDVHAAIFFAERRFEDGLLDIVNDGRAVEQLLDTFSAMPAHYKYIVAVDPNPVAGHGRFDLAERHLQSSFSPDGVGRVGFLAVEMSGSDDVRPRVVVKPERFRAKVSPLVDRYIETHSPDWEIRA